LALSGVLLNVGGEKWGIIKKKINTPNTPYRPKRLNRATRILKKENKNTLHFLWGEGVNKKLASPGLGGEKQKQKGLSLNAPL